MTKFTFKCRQIIGRQVDIEAETEELAMMKYRGYMDEIGGYEHFDYCEELDEDEIVEIIKN